ncbi:MAG: M67 family metallopeptidase [Victivallales bacterium]|nr:M67 family metallopeptidase [Victivallales bacterium]
MLKLTKQIEEEIRQAGEKAYPNECCGIMFGSEEGDDHVVKSLKPIDNARESDEQYHRFLITAEDMMQAELEVRKQRLEIVGFYHSHPDHPSKPSDYDRDHALPFYSYIILRVAEGKADLMTSWRLQLSREAFDSEPFEIEP